MDKGFEAHTTHVGLQLNQTEVGQIMTELTKENGQRVFTIQFQRGIDFQKGQMIMLSGPDEQQLGVGRITSFVDPKEGAYVKISFEVIGE